MGIGAKLLYTKGFLTDGRVFKNVTDLKTFKENHGAGLTIFHRAQLIQFLYDNLPDEAKARYLLNKNVTSVESGEHGVEVNVADGTIYKGAIAIGADGVHSVTRKIVRELALAENPQREWDPENPFPAEYRCLWCSFPRPSEPGQSFETSAKNLSAMYLTGRDYGWIMVYDRFPKPTTERHTYTDKDIEEFAAKVADYPLTENLKARDVFEKRQTWGLSDLGEGIVEHWSWGRIVLVGDAIHKFTPNAGLGLNNAIQDIVALTNGLCAAIKAAPVQPDNETISEVFRTYREQRLQGLQQDYNRSALVTRLQAWASHLHYFFSRFVLSWPFAANFLVDHLVSPVVRKGLVLNFVSSTDLPASRVNWEHQIPGPQAVQ
ncbi:FAD/NAD(P)-binding domain-containing protein [Xylariaceae sp. FL0662B]|nr:FAD/NAD(P)-binding domain-containing protein [Xylariaceae sp. FL0662B]